MHKPFHGHLRPVSWNDTSSMAQETAVLHSNKSKWRPYIRTPTKYIIVINRDLLVSQFLVLSGFPDSHSAFVQSHRIELASVGQPSMGRKTGILRPRHVANILISLSDGKTLRHHKKIQFLVLVLLSYRFFEPEPASRTSSYACCI